MNTLYMWLWKPTHSQYAHRRVVATFGVPISYYNEWGLTHISRELLYLAGIEAVWKEVHMYNTTGALLNAEWSEERLWTHEEEW